MQIKSIFTTILLLSATWAATAQRLTTEAYIALYKDLAIREMKRMGVPAAITLAQGILETESGNSTLVKKSNNHFGIKCKSTWIAEGVSHDDDAPGECFRKYNTPEESYRDHSNFLRGNERYGFLFRLDVTDYKGWAHGLKKAGYATNPAYPQILIKNIEQYNLQQYTLEGAADAPRFESNKYTSDPEIKFDPEKEAAVPAMSTPDTIAIANIPDMIRVDGIKAVQAKKGTSLLAIAEKFNIRLVNLLSFNQMAKDGILQTDRIVYLEKNNKAAAIMPAAANTHIVQPKEGLYAISKKYNITVQQLREWNNLTTDDLRIGQELIIAR
jgi:LysM repeat protein